MRKELWMSREFNVKIVVFTVFCVLIVSLFSFYVLYISKNINSEKKHQDNGVHRVLDLNDVEVSLDLAEQWLVSNLKEKGCFNYIYDPSTDEYSSSNNMIRQLMASRVLAELSQDNVSLQVLLQKNLDFMFDYWYKEDGDKGYIFYSDKSKLGAIAMALRTLVYSPFFDDEQVEAKKLANCILYLQNNDGSLEPWYIEPGYDYDKDYLLTFYSGEAILSLVDLYLKTNNDVYLDAAILSQDYYVDRYVTHLEDNYYPAYVPWHTQSLNKLYKITEKEEYADVIMVLNDELLKIQDTTNNATLGRFYNPSHPEYGSPHSSSDGVYTEGLAYAYEIADMIDDEYHKEKYSNATALGVHNLISLQYTESNTGSVLYPEKVIGAIRYGIDDGRIRIDTTQHTIDAYMKVLLVFD